MPALRALLVSFLASITFAWASADPWTPPAVDTTPACLPRLNTPLEIDGNLDEWAGAVSTALRDRSCLVFEKAPHTWDGPADASMEIYTAWTDSGLCLAVAVSDEDLQVEEVDTLLWTRDCIELFLDVRGPEEIGRQRYSKGTYQLFYRPPTESVPERFKGNFRQGTIEGLKSAGQRTSDGYRAELFIPWKGLPCQTTPAQIGLQFGFDDYDSGDGTLWQPVMMTYGGAEALYSRADRFVRHRLVDSIALGPTSSLGTLVAVSNPEVVMDLSPVRIEVNPNRFLGSRTAAFRTRVLASDGAEAFRQTVAVATCGASRPCPTSFVWQPDSAAAGYHTVEVQALTADSTVLGAHRSSIMCIAPLISGGIGHLAAVSLDSVTKKNPFAAAAWCGAAACIERMKYAADKQDTRSLLRLDRELVTRFSLLETGRMPQGANDELMGLLRLATDPSAQVVVDYPRDSTANVSFYWGAIPIGAVDVRLHADSTAALAALADRSIFRGPSVEVEEPGLRGQVSRFRFNYISIDTATFAPATQAIAVDANGRWSDAVDTDLLQYLNVDTVLVAGPCPEPFFGIVKKWAGSKRIEVKPAPTSPAKGRYLVAGDSALAYVMGPLGKGSLSSVLVDSSSFSVAIAAGRLSVRTRAAGRGSALLAARLALSGKPLAVADVDRLREATVAAIPASGIKKARLGKDHTLHCGDHHTHTFFSDGRPSPTGLLLQGIYSNLDYMVMTDHNTIAGAEQAVALAESSGIDFDLVVGEEITMKWGHFNAYPLKERIAPSDSLPAIIAAARAQGAAIQINHPGYPDPAWAQPFLKGGLGTIGLDAWEHIPATVREWEASGTLPRLVGSTDTHNGTFGDQERTVLSSVGISGPDIAQAVREGRIALVEPSRSPYSFGPNDTLRAVLRAQLEQGRKLKKAKAVALRQALGGADLAAMVRATPAKPVSIATADRK